MAFCLRAFCRDFAAPSLSELLVWLKQYETPATIVPGTVRPDADLLSSFWDQVQLSYDEAEAPLTVRCLRATGTGAVAFAEELADFVSDIEELPDSQDSQSQQSQQSQKVRARVLEQLASTRLLVLVEFPPEGVSFTGQQTAEGVVNSLVERAGGMAQHDGAGFLDPDDDSVILPLA